MSEIGDLMERARAAKEDADKAKGQVTEQKDKQALQELFDKVLRGKFSLIPQGTRFPGEWPGVDSVLVIPPRAQVKQVFIVVNYRKGEKFANDTFTLSPEGNLTGGGKALKDIPGLTAEALMLETLSNLEKIDLGKWIEVDGEIFPPEQTERGEGAPRASAQELPPTLNADRLGELISRSDVLFGFTSKQSGGFQGYHVFVFDSEAGSFLVAEHPKKGNAAYIIDIPKIDLGDEHLTHDRMTELARSGEIQDALAVSRAEQRRRGSSFVIHINDWESKRLALIEERLNKKSSGPMPEQEAAE
ncbi:MAG: hypothetical protein AAB974_03735 [Patescibacteria group bacterium]